jgi:hypothetical protein
MPLLERVYMQSFAGATEWLNSEPLVPAEMGGLRHLREFGRLTCIKWMRQEARPRRLFERGGGGT